MARRNVNASKRGTERKDSTTNGKGKPRETGARSTAASSQTSGFKSSISEQLIRDVASFSFGSPVGSNLHLGNNSPSVDTYGLPGILTLGWVPTAGYSTHAASPVNLAARELMTRVRAANSGRRNYDQTSLMLYILGVDSAYIYLAWMKRLYGMMMVSNPLSKYMPESLVRACGADHQDLIMNLADFRAYINTFATRLSALPIPNIPVTARHQEMSRGVYMDAETGKAQLFVFNPEALYIYAYDTTTSLGYLVETAMPFLTRFSPADAETTLNYMTSAQIKAFGETILTPLLITYGEEDFAIMGGDILKAFGAEGIQRAIGIPEDYVVVPEYDELMLHRIMNSSAYGLYDWTPTSTAITASFNVTQNVTDAPISSFLSSQPYLEISNQLLSDNQAVTDNQILNSQSGPMAPDVALECLSFKTIPYLDGDVGGSSYFQFRTAGTEYITRYFITFFENTTGVPSLHHAVSMTTYFAMVAFFDASTDIDLSQVASTVRDAVAKLALIDQFDFHPFLQCHVAVLDSTDLPNWTELGSAEALNVFGDLSDSAVVTFGDLERVRNVKTLVDFGL